MLEKLSSAILICLALPCTVNALTRSECEEIKSLYGIEPADCIVQNVAPARVQGTGTGPTEEQRQNNVFFSRGGVGLDETASRQVAQLAVILNSGTLRQACIKLVGHSDSSGGAAANLEIAKRRAIAVRDALMPLLDNPGRITLVEGLGERTPLNNLPPASNWQRRVEIWARDCR